MPLHTGTDIQQILPLDCCFSMAVLSKDLKIYDCRYWGATHQYNHVQGADRWHIMEFPRRTAMYEEGVVSQTHQRLYGKSNYIEEYDHCQRKSFLEEMIAEISPESENLPRVSNCINSMAVFGLLAAHPITVLKKEVWLQTSENGGLFLECGSSEETLAVFSPD